METWQGLARRILAHVAETFRDPGRGRRVEGDLLDRSGVPLPVAFDAHGLHPEVFEYRTGLTGLLVGLLLLLGSLGLILGHPVV
jgi:hypothetical protein